MSSQPVPVPTATRMGDHTFMQVQFNEIFSISATNQKGEKR